MSFRSTMAPISEDDIYIERARVRKWIFRIVLANAAPVLLLFPSLLIAFGWDLSLWPAWARIAQQLVFMLCPAIGLWMSWLDRRMQVRPMIKFPVDRQTWMLIDVGHHDQIGCTGRVVSQASTPQALDRSATVYGDPMVVVMTHYWSGVMAVSILKP